MSWSYRFEAPAEHLAFAAAGEAALLAATTPNEDGSTQIPAEQIEKGMEAMKVGLASAVSIVMSGVVGSEDKIIHCGISGHSNADHAPEEGWANDAIMVSLSQA